MVHVIEATDSNVKSSLRDEIMAVAIMLQMNGLGILNYLKLDNQWRKIKGK
jgi:hypothetical protein